jgi:hypothetical protein
MTYKELSIQERLLVMEFVADILSRPHLQFFEVGAEVYKLPDSIRSVALEKLSEYIAKMIAHKFPGADISIDYQRLLS